MSGRKFLVLSMRKYSNKVREQQSADNPIESKAQNPVDLDRRYDELIEAARIRRVYRRRPRRI